MLAAAMATTTMATEETMVATEAAEVEATEAITMVLAMMDMVAETEVMATAHLHPLAASKTSHLHSPHKLQHTLAAMVAVVCLHLLLLVGCLVWLPLPLNITKVVTVEVTIIMVAATTITEEVMEEAATITVEGITMVVDIVAEEEEEAVEGVEVVMTDIRRGLLPDSEKISSTKSGTL
jgi:hypothetical protein